MQIVIGSDHAGFHLKQELIQWLEQAGHQIDDVGSYNPEPVDFPDIAFAVCNKVREGNGLRGILVCGTGVGAVIAANKVKGIRAAVGHDVHSAHQSVEHDDVNVLCIGAQIVGPWLARDLIDAFLQATFVQDADFIRRVEKLAQLEQHN
ncbi:MULTISPECIES: ribose 5-phosphate isomerase B [Atlantibacter]|jgi:ribose 5-phosphate isomerase B|uniref:Ribose 5-phosphate isomerase B n=1 Tax=Atlantibacter subterraneus TaxID=255519 RepID=A0A427V029_9ENTR|nr:MULTISPECIES: ribose 5-phosphate isomerase B [Atlantibacter]QFH69973.1 ribose 5-phosphate isomerase B [Enterobacter sp. E76]MDA3131840.1 ribose 5-phosphate isomerase B [Atlantibacter subterranea]MDW2744755.1 ribose 5-phosphate isomerase B [Atlantibacter subterranea]RSB62216.1 ribose 5-phosphate isomerase B [Atlantibacter subterranea]RSE06958.1 ribose 5-phosphate isomerase B [Atlantibacter subterranea]